MIFNWALLYLKNLNTLSLIAGDMISMLSTEKRWFCYVAQTKLLFSKSLGGLSELLDPTPHIAPGSAKFDSY